MYHGVVYLDMSSTDAAEYAAVTISVHNVHPTIVSAYVRLGVVWDPRDLIHLRRLCAAIVFYVWRPQCPQQSMG